MAGPELLGLAFPSGISLDRIGEGAKLPTFQVPPGIGALRGAGRVRLGR